MLQALPPSQAGIAASREPLWSAVLRGIGSWRRYGSSRQSLGMLPMKPGAACCDASSGSKDDDAQRLGLSARAISEGSAGGGYESGSSIWRQQSEAPGVLGARTLHLEGVHTLHLEASRLPAGARTLHLEGVAKKAAIESLLDLDVYRRGRPNDGPDPPTPPRASEPSWSRASLAAASSRRQGGGSDGHVRHGCLAVSGLLLAIAGLYAC